MKMVNESLIKTPQTARRFNKCFFQVTNNNKEKKSKQVKNKQLISRGSIPITVFDRMRRTNWEQSYKVYHGQTEQRNVGHQTAQMVQDKRDYVKCK